MIVELTQHAATILEADDLRRLHLTTDLPPDAVQEALTISRIGREFDGTRVVLLVEELHRRAAGAATIDNWEQRWEAMIDFARSHGWLTPDQTGVLAHVEKAGSTR